MTIPFFTHPALSSETIRHGFFTREGGVSTGSYTSLNCGIGSGDAPEHVLENQRRISAALSADLLFLRQVHSNTVITVSRNWPIDERPEADAMVSRTNGLALAVMSADCAPVLFHDDKAGVIGAAHAGWKGAHAGILEETIAAMLRLGASARHITAVIGPCIQQSSYEVGPEFPATFLVQDEANKRFFKTAPRSGHFLFDLPGYAESRLAHCGIGAIYSLGLDTVTGEQQFFSYRRRTLRGEPKNGVQMSAIALS